MACTTVNVQEVDAGLNEILLGNEWLTWRKNYKQWRGGHEESCYQRLLPCLLSSQEVQPGRAAKPLPRIGYAAPDASKMTAKGMLAILKNVQAAKRRAREAQAEISRRAPALNTCDGMYSGFRWVQG